MLGGLGRIGRLGLGGGHVCDRFCGLRVALFLLGGASGALARLALGLLRVLGRCRGRILALVEQRHLELLDGRDLRAGVLAVLGPREPSVVLRPHAIPHVVLLGELVGQAHLEDGNAVLGAGHLAVLEPLVLDVGLFGFGLGFAVLRDRLGLLFAPCGRVVAYAVLNAGELVVELELEGVEGDGLLLLLVLARVLFLGRFLLCGLGLGLVRAPGAFLLLHVLVVCRGQFLGTLNVQAVERLGGLLRNRCRDLPARLFRRLCQADRGHAVCA